MNEIGNDHVVAGKKPRSLRAHRLLRLTRGVNFRQLWKLYYRSLIDNGGFSSGVSDSRELLAIEGNLQRRGIISRNDFELSRCVSAFIAFTTFQHVSDFRKSER